MSFNAQTFLSHFADNVHVYCAGQLVVAGDLINFSSDSCKAPYGFHASSIKKGHGQLSKCGKAATF